MTRPDTTAPYGLALTIAVHLLEPRYHGAGDWPPSPFRLFQALVAGALLGRPRDHRDTLTDCFAWLESLDPPIIAAPPVSPGTRVTFYVPNNDLDAVGGDPAKVPEIRDAKRVQPQLLEDDRPILYAWAVPATAEAQAQQVADLASSLFRLGTGLDVAWATAQVGPLQALDQRLAEHGGALHRPLPTRSDDSPPLQSMAPHAHGIRCPAGGSFASLASRHDAQARRFHGGGFRQAPNARFRVHPYDAAPIRLLFDIVDPGPPARPTAHPLKGVVEVTEQIRDALAARLRHGGEPDTRIEAVIIGRGATDTDKTRRVRLIPLPSIGSHHADRAIRRLLVEVPAGCSITAETVTWALTGWDLSTDPQTGELPAAPGPTLVPDTGADSMLRHYGLGDPFKAAARVWRTVTPAALPLRRARGRAAGRDRAATEAHLAAAVQTAVRHAGLPRATAIRVQREPFEVRGERAEIFAPGTRFAPNVLHHVEVAFDTPVTGPLLIGDGRFLGLGLLAPVRTGAGTSPDLCLLRLADPVAAPHRTALLRAVRRALIWRAEHDPEAPTAKPLISGHAADGAPLGGGRHAHIFLTAVGPAPAGPVTHVLVVPPWRFDPGLHPGAPGRRAFQRVVGDLREVRAGALGVLTLRPDDVAALPAVLGPAREWQSTTPYRPTRHPRDRARAETAIARDIGDECRRRGLPRPTVTVNDLTMGPRGGTVSARVTLRFAVAVPGPILLGRDCHHHGGGLFHACFTDSP